MSYKGDVMDILNKAITKHHIRSHSKKGTKNHGAIDWYLDNYDEVFK